MSSARFDEVFLKHVIFKRHSKGFEFPLLFVKLPG